MTEINAEIFKDKFQKIHGQITKAHFKNYENENLMRKPNTTSWPKTERDITLDS